MIVYNVTFFYLPRLADGVRSWLSETWVPAAAAAGCQAPMALAMDNPDPDLHRVAVQAYFADEASLQSFVDNEVALLLGDMQARFGRENVLAHPTVMTCIDL